MPYCIICARQTDDCELHLKKAHREAYKNIQEEEISVTAFFIKEYITKVIIDSIGGVPRIKAHDLNTYKQRLKKEAARMPPKTFNEKEYKFSYADITFKDKEIVITEITKTKNFSIKCDESVPVLETMKEQLYRDSFGNKICKLYASGNSILINQSPDVQKLIEAVKTTIARERLRQRQKRLPSKRSQDDRASVLRIPKYINDPGFRGFDPAKEGFFQFLYDLSDKQEKIYVVEETVGNSKEQGLVFILTSVKGKRIIVWENVYTKRATKVFTYVSSSTLLKLIALINAENVGALREALSNNKNKNKEQRKITQEYHFKCSLNHTDLNKFQKDILDLLRGTFFYQQNRRT